MDRQFVRALEMVHMGTPDLDVQLSGDQQQGGAWWRHGTGLDKLRSVGDGCM